MKNWLRVWGCWLLIVGAGVLGWVGTEWRKAPPPCPADVKSLPTSKPCRSSLPSGFSKPIIALELARTSTAVEAVRHHYQNLQQDWQAVVKNNLTLDAALVIPIYGAILLGFGCLLLRRHRWLAALVLGCAGLAVLGDYAENYGIRQVLSAWEAGVPGDTAANDLLRWVWLPSWFKWLVLYVGFGGTAGLFFTKPQPGNLPKWAWVLAAVSGTAFLLGGVIGLVGAVSFWWGHGEPLEAGFLPILIGWVSGGLLLLLAPDWRAGENTSATTEALPVPLFRVLLQEHEVQQRQRPKQMLQQVRLATERYDDLERQYNNAAKKEEERKQRIAELERRYRSVEKDDQAQRAQLAGELQKLDQEPTTEERRAQLRAEMQNLNDQFVEDFYRQIHQQAKDPAHRRTAICFSGGGVRSATYALGLLQGLLKKGVRLGDFHYLSTVSGGGYTGSWLTAWLHRAGTPAVEAALKAEAPLNPLEPEPAPLRHLRQYSNPLTPSLGLFSADTWTLVGIYVRNLSLNWLVLLPLLMVFLAVPRLAMAFACWNEPDAWLLNALPFVGLLLGCLTVAYFIANRPSLVRLGRPFFKKLEWRRDETEFLWYGLLPLLAEAALLAAYWAWAAIRYDKGAEVVLHTRWWLLLLGLCGVAALVRLAYYSTSQGETGGQAAQLMLLAGAIGMFGVGGYWFDPLNNWKFSLTEPLIFCLFAWAKYGGGIFLSWLWTGCWDRREVGLALPLAGLLGGLALCGVAQLHPKPVNIAALQAKPGQAQAGAGLSPTPQPAKQVVKLAGEPVSLALEAAAPGQPAALKLETPVNIEAQPGRSADALKAEQQLAVVKKTGWYVVFGLPLFLFAFLAAATVFIGLASGITTDADREWMGRAGAWMLLVGGLWVVVSTTVLFGPEWVWRANGYLVSALTAGSGLTTLILGWLPKTAATTQGQGQTGRLLKLLLPLAALIFALALFAWLAIATDLLLRACAQSELVQLVYANWLPTIKAPQSLLRECIEPTDVVQWHWLLLHELPGVFVAFVVLLLLGIGGVAGLFINVNKFSLHAANRDRLIRAYLGASNEQRRADAFTGFDARDDLQLHETFEPLFTAASFKNFAGFVVWLNKHHKRQKALAGDAVARFLWRSFAATTRQRLRQALNELADLTHVGQAQWVERHTELQQLCAQELNRIIHGELLVPVQPPEQRGLLAKIFYLPARAEAVFDRSVIAKYLAEQPQVSACPVAPRPLHSALAKRIPVKQLWLNRLLLEAACANFLHPCDKRPPEARPFHVVNMALNLVNGKELAWQERKARSFFATPLHAGAPGVGLRPVEEYAITYDGKGALTLGTALAISGAAANPNAGYHSSPLIAFFLTFFNVRLGWWLGNPGLAGQHAYRTSSPFFAPNVLLAELFGFTDDQHPYINVSDGGHFDNLGLYEMVRRRCHFIIVSDGGQDDKYAYDDLGIAIRLIRADLGVPIEFRTPLCSGSHGAGTDKRVAPPNQLHYTIAEINYQAVDGAEAENGVLILVKPAVYGKEPADIYNYALSNPAFPNDPTFTDQFFSESQFESYRHLGEYTVAELVNGLVADHNQDDLSLAELEQQARVCISKPAAPCEPPGLRDSD